MFRSLLLLTVFLVGCQSNPHKAQYTGRTLKRLPSTSSQLIRTFVRELAEHSEHNAAAIERRVLSFMREVDEQTGKGNWEQMGITSREEAMRINSLYDDVPNVDKLRLWVRGNIHRIGLKFERQVAENAYNAMMGASSRRLNPYTKEAMEMTQRLEVAQGRLKPTFFSSINSEQRIVSLETAELLKISRALKKGDAESVRKIASQHKQVQGILFKRGQSSPSVAANGNLIVASANDIAKYTGRPAMGEGCKDFLETASEITLGRKASIDVEWAERVIDRAIQKANREFASFADLPEHLRLTMVEIDDELVEALRIINALDESEARLVLKRLKSGPCKIYPN